MPLTDIKIRAAKPATKLKDDGSERLVTKKLSDGGGLQLWCEPDGGRRWRLAYRFDGKQRVLALGVYPALSLKEARVSRDEAKRFLREGRDPGAERKATKTQAAIANGSTFGVICGEVVEKKRREGKAHGTMQTLTILKQMASPLSDRPIAEIVAPEVLTLLRTVEGRGTYAMAQRLRAFIGEVFRYAVATGRVLVVDDESDIVAIQLDMLSALGLTAVGVGGADEAIQLWKAQPASTPVHFNCGMAALFSGRPAEARAPLGQAVSQLPEDSAWHHLGRLYLALAEARAA